MPPIRRQSTKTKLPQHTAAALQRYRAKRLPDPWVQCSGITAKDTRCTRMVATTASLVYPNAADYPFYCNTHLNTAFYERRYRCLRYPSETRPFSGMYLTSHRTYHSLFYIAYVRPYLEARTQVLQRELLRRPPSKFDKWGYLYGLQMDGTSGRLPYPIPIIILSRPYTTRRPPHQSRHHDQPQQAVRRAPQKLSGITTGVARPLPAQSRQLPIFLCSR